MKQDVLNQLTVLCFKNSILENRIFERESFKGRSFSQFSEKFNIPSQNEILSAHCYFFLNNTEHYSEIHECFLCNYQ